MGSARKRRVKRLVSKTLERAERKDVMQEHKVGAASARSVQLTEEKIHKIGLYGWGGEKPVFREGDLTTLSDTLSDTNELFSGGGTEYTVGEATDFEAKQHGDATAHFIFGLGRNAIDPNNSEGGAGTNHRQISLPALSLESSNCKSIIIYSPNGPKAPYMAPYIGLKNAGRLYTMKFDHSITGVAGAIGEPFNKTHLRLYLKGKVGAQSPMIQVYTGSNDPNTDGIGPGFYDLASTGAFEFSDSFSSGSFFIPTSSLALGMTIGWTRDGAVESTYTASASDEPGWVLIISGSSMPTGSQLDTAGNWTEELAE